MVSAAEIGERKHRYARFLAETASLLRGHDGDFSEIFRAGVDIDRGIRQEVDISFGRDQHIDAGHTAQFRPDVDYLERGANRVRIVGRCV